jgi:hypothetical protein
LQPSFWPGHVRLTESAGFFFPYFFFNPARFQIRVDPSGRVGPDFKTMHHIHLEKKKKLLLLLLSLLSSSGSRFPSVKWKKKKKRLAFSLLLFWGSINNNNNKKTKVSFDQQPPLPSSFFPSSADPLFLFLKVTRFHLSFPKPAIYFHFSWYLFLKSQTWLID